MKSTDVLIALLCARLILVLSLTRSKLQRPWIRTINFSQHLVPYTVAFRWQQELMDHHILLQDCKNQNAISCHEKPDIHEGNCVGTLLCVQHPHVYTLGTATDTNSSGPFSNIDKQTNEPLTFETVRVDRGGQATYHGPGQLVFYPILDLNYFDKDVDKYLRSLESGVIQLLRHYQIPDPHTIPGYTGVWVTDSTNKHNYKLSAIGIKLRRWVTLHGVSVNLNVDMRYFHNILPCGINKPDKHVDNMWSFLPPSLKEDHESVVTVPHMSKTLLPILEQLWNVECRNVNAEDLVDTDPLVVRNIFNDMRSVLSNEGQKEFRAYTEQIRF